MKTYQSALDKIPFIDIHKIIRESNTETRAADQLNVSHKSLSNYLTYRRYQGLPLNFNSLHLLTPAQLEEEYGEKYLQFIPPVYIDLNQIPLSRIHFIILSSSGSAMAANKLGVTDTVLEKHLGKCSLSYVELKNLTIPQAQEKYKENYPLPLQAKEIRLEQRTLAEIHQIIRNHQNRNQSAHQLGVSPEQLESQLKKIKFPEEPLSYQRLKSLAKKTLRTALGDAYKQPLVMLIAESLNPIPILLNQPIPTQASPRKRRSDTELNGQDHRFFKSRKAADQAGQVFIDASSQSHDDVQQPIDSPEKTQANTGIMAENKLLSVSCSTSGINLDYDYRDYQTKSDQYPLLPPLSTMDILDSLITTDDMAIPAYRGAWI